MAYGHDKARRVARAKVKGQGDSGSLATTGSAVANAEGKGKSAPVTEKAAKKK